MTRESKFEAALKKELEETFPGCMVLKGNSAMRQGIPDRILLHGKNWAALEVKPDSKADKQPNQDWYVEKLGDMSYAAVITPDNMHEVINEIQTAFGIQG